MWAEGTEYFHKGTIAFKLRALNKSTICRTVQRFNRTVHTNGGVERSPNSQLKPSINSGRETMTACAPTTTAAAADVAKTASESRLTMPSSRSVATRRASVKVDDSATRCKSHGRSSCRSRPMFRQQQQQQQRREKWRAASDGRRTCRRRSTHRCSHCSAQLSVAINKN